MLSALTDMETWQKPVSDGGFLICGMEQSKSLNENRRNLTNRTVQNRENMLYYL